MQWMHSGHCGYSRHSGCSECSGCSGHAVDAVNAVYTVGVAAKMSTHTLYSANMGGGDHYL